MKAEKIVVAQPKLTEPPQPVNKQLEELKIETSTQLPQPQMKQQQRGGLIKLDKTKLDELIASESEKKTTSSKQQQQQQHHHYHANDEHVRMLFDPSNPDKPIYVGGGGAKRGLILTNGSSTPPPSQPTHHQTNEPETMINESVVKVSQLVRRIQYVEAQLKQLIDQFDTISHDFNETMSNINQLRCIFQSFLFIC